MPTWDTAVEAIRAAADGPQAGKRRWFPFVKRTPIVVTGGPGSGKTEVWRQLTGGEAPDAMSKEVEKGHFFAAPRESITIFTIAGQPSADRFTDLNLFFGAGRRLDGVVFVASYGFERVWSENARTVARQLDPFTADSLSDRNVRRELDSFRETCAKIREKVFVSRGESDYTPRWLLVVVNKADLYWDAIDGARNYYNPGSGSDFDETATRMIEDIEGRLDYGFRYEAMPVTLKPRTYDFAFEGQSIVVPTQLSYAHAEASVKMLGDTLRELCGF
jgi:hypothetical protein